MAAPPGYGLQAECIGATQLWVLPSPSGQARGHWNLAPWQALADYIADFGKPMRR
jgi:TDG/mug DNA glycosylase family protein